jgi:predicted acyltransferase
LASFSIIYSGTLYFVSFIFVFMMLHYFGVNYTQATGSSYSRIPEPYYTQLEVFESNTLSSFIISVIILSLLLSQYTYSFIAPGNYKTWFAKNKPNSVWYDLYVPWYAIFEVILSITLITISTNQIIAANGFQKLTRQEILPTNPTMQ